MKRMICLVLALALLLCACSSAPAETTAPAMDNDMAEDGRDQPIPEETAQTTASSPKEYTLTIEDPETVIYAGAGFCYEAVALIEEAGVYTITLEVYDTDGNLWGRLKSGAGWVCLTDPAWAPIYADYAEESFNAYYAYWSDETDYITSIGFTPAEKLTNVEFGLLDWFETESWQMSEVLYTMDELDPDRAFLAQVVFWGDMTTYGIRFTDASGERRHYAVSISGKDGSLLCTEYTP